VCVRCRRDADDSYLVTRHGRRPYFTGDTESLDALVAANDLDAAFVSPWLFREALARGRPIDARRTPIRYRRIRLSFG
jgi:hypothetical protein